MKKQEGGFIGIALIVIIAVVLVGGGAYVYKEQTLKISSIDNSSMVDSKTESSEMDKNLNDAKDSINSSLNKQLITETTVKIDSKGNRIPSLVVDPNVATDLVVEKYGGVDSAYARQLVEVRWKALGAGLVAESSFKRNNNDGSYAQSCDGATEYLVTEIKRDLLQDEEEGSMLKKLGITLESYNIGQFKCVDSENGFVATVPLTLRDGTKTQFCISSTGTGVTDADWKSMTCLK